MDANGMGSAEFISMIFARMDFTRAIPFPALVLITIKKAGYVQWKSWFCYLLRCMLLSLYNVLK